MRKYQFLNSLDFTLVASLFVVVVCNGLSLII